MTKRLKFFLGHLSISLIIGMIVLFLSFFVWYPEPLHKALDVTQIIFMIIIIDMIVGPLLGLIVYKEGKKTLRMDLSIIIFVQFCAFLYGFYTIAQGRPAWAVYSNNLFTLVKTSDIDTMNIRRAKPQFRQVPLLGVGYAQLNQKIVGDNSPPAVARRPDYYEELDAKNLKALPLNLLERFNDKNLVSQIVAQSPKANGWLPLAAPHKSMVILINNDSKEIISIVDLRPW